MDLSIIIVNYNVKYFLEQCLHSILKAIKNIGAEIIVIDNNSTDGSREYLEPKFPQVIFKWSKINAGFATANNSALKNASGRHILFLNPDTIVPEDCFEKCLGFFRTTENCGALGVRMIDGSGFFLKESKRGLPSPLAAFYKMAGIAKIFPSSKLFSKYYAGNLPENEINAVEVLAGAFMMIDKKALELVKGFDESFFMYGEDIDLSYRIMKEGFKNYYFPDTTIIHFKGESTRKETALYIHRFYDAMYLFVSKHYAKRKVTTLSMFAAISLSKYLSFLKLFLKKSIKNFSGSRDLAMAYDTIVICDDAYFNKLVQLIKHAINSLTIIGRISFDKNTREDIIENPNYLIQMIRTKKASYLMFCEGAVDYKKIIEMAQQLKGSVDFLFHKNGSFSIVGSNYTNENGIVISQSFPGNL